MHPKMALIQPSINLDMTILTIKGCGFPDLEIDLRSNNIHLLTKEVKVCGTSKCGGILWGGHSASSWFSSFLGVQCWLARYVWEKHISRKIEGREQMEELSKTNKNTTIERSKLVLLLLKLVLI